MAESRALGTEDRHGGRGRCQKSREEKVKWERKNGGGGWGKKGTTRAEL